MVDGGGGGGFGGGGDEVEDDVFGAGGVLEDGEDGRHRAAEVGRVEGHCHVDGVAGARDVRVAADGGARGGVVEFWSFLEPLSGGCGAGGGVCGEEEEEDTREEEEGGVAGGGRFCCRKCH